MDRVLEILHQDNALAAMLAPGSQIDYGRIMTGGCKGFATKFMEWPESLILGAIARDANKKITRYL